MAPDDLATGDVGLLINVSMWLERYIIIPEGLTINRMPCTWKLYVPSIEIALTIGLLALLLLLYMLASRLIPLVQFGKFRKAKEAI